MKYIALLSILIFPSFVFAQQKSTPQNSKTFEYLSSTAVIISNIEKVVSPFLQTCGTSSQLPDLHCRAIRDYMQRKASRKIYLYSTDYNALQFGTYDNTKFSYPITVKGCITCKSPAMFDPHLFKKKYYITTKTPTKVENNELKGIEVGKFSLLVDPRKLGEWTKKVKPFLSVQFLFKIGNKSIWDSKIGDGITLHMGGFRVYNRCTGKVLYSVPPSENNAPINKDGCENLNKPKQINNKPKLPYKPAGTSILQVMRSIKSKVADCYKQYQIPGIAHFKLTIQGPTGKIIKLKLKGDFVDTPTGTCVTKIIKKLSFPKFRKPKLTFSYKYFLK